MEYGMGYNWMSDDFIGTSLDPVIFDVLWTIH